MKKHKGLERVILLVLSLVLPLFFSSYAHAGSSKHVNIAAFHKISSSYEFEPIVVGSFSDFIREMEKGSEIVFLNHTANVIDGDVITLSASVLRSTADGFNDEGSTCSISFFDSSTADNTAYSVGGICTIIHSAKGEIIKSKTVIPSADLPDTSQGIDVWVMLEEDSKNGIAFYANVSSSTY